VARSGPSYRSIRRRVRCLGQDGRHGPTPGEYPRHWGVECDGPGGGDRQWRHLHAWPRPCGLAWPGASASDDRRGKPRLLGISKRGNKYLRKLLIHGARAALPSLLASPTPIGRWLQGLMARAHKNRVVVALANNGPDHVGSATPRRHLQRCCCEGDLIKMAECASVHPAEEVCGWLKRDGLTVVPAFRQPGTEKWRSTPIEL
jgi:hypothetical protein